MLHFTFNKKTLAVVTLLLHPAISNANLYAPVMYNIINMDKSLEHIFSKENNQTLLECCNALKNKIAQLEQSLEVLASDNSDEYAQAIYSIGKEVTRQLTNVVVVLEKGKDTKPILAITLGKAIIDTCDVPKLFASVKEEIKVLKEQAIQEKNTSAVKNLDNLWKIINQIDTKWQQMEPLLLPGLKHRLKQK